MFGNIEQSTPLHAYLEEPGSTWNVHGPLYGHIWGNNVTVYSDGLIHADIGGSNPNAASHVGWKNSTWVRGKKRI